MQPPQLDYFMHPYIPGTGMEISKCIEDRKNKEKKTEYWEKDERNFFDRILRKMTAISRDYAYYRMPKI